MVSQISQVLRLVFKSYEHYDIKKDCEGRNLQGLPDAPSDDNTELMVLLMIEHTEKYFKGKEATVSSVLEYTFELYEHNEMVEVCSDLGVSTDGDKARLVRNVIKHVDMEVITLNISRVSVADTGEQKKWFDGWPKGKKLIEAGLIDIDGYSGWICKSSLPEDQKKLFGHGHGGEFPRSGDAASRRLFWVTRKYHPDKDGFLFSKAQWTDEDKAKIKKEATDILDTTKNNEIQFIQFYGRLKIISKSKPIPTKVKQHYKKLVKDGGRCCNCTKAIHKLQDGDDEIDHKNDFYSVSQNNHIYDKPSDYQLTCACCNKVKRSDKDEEYRAPSHGYEVQYLWGGQEKLDLAAKFPTEGTYWGDVLYWKANVAYAQRARDEGVVHANKKEFEEYVRKYKKV